MHWLEGSDAVSSGTHVAHSRYRAALRPVQFLKY